MNKSILKISVLFFVSTFMYLCNPVEAFAVTCTSAGSGNWNATGTWSGCTGGNGSVANTPGSNDTAIITSTHNVTVTGNETVSALTFGSASTGGILTVNSGVTLTVTNALTMQSNNAANTAGTIQNGTGNATVTAGSLVIGDATAPTGARTAILTSTISTLTISGNVTTTCGDGTGSRAIDPRIHLSSGNMSVSGTISLCVLDAGEASFLMNQGDQVGTLTLLNSNPWNVTSGAVTTLNGSTSTVVYSGASPAMRVTPYQYLTINGSGTPTGAVTSIAGSLLVSGSVTWTLSATSILSLQTAGTASVTTGGNTTISGNLTISSGSTFTTGANHTLAVSNSTAVAGTLANANTGAKTYIGLVTILSGGSFTNANNSSIEFRGGFLNDSTGTVSFGTGAVTFTTNSQDVSGSEAINFGGSVTITGAITITNTNTSTVTITSTLDGSVSGSTWRQGSGSYLILARNGTVFPTAGTLDSNTNANNTVEYSGGSSTVISNVTYGNLTISGSVSTGTQTATVGGIFSVTGTFTPSAGTVTFNNGSSIANSGGTITFQALTIAASATVSVTAGNFTVGGTFTANSGSTVNFTSTSAQTVPGLTYVNMGVGTTANSTATVYTLGGNITVSGTLTVGNSGSTAVDQLAGSNRTINLTGSGTVFSIDSNWGSFTANTSTVQYTGTNAQNIAPAGYYGLEVTTTTARTATFTAGGTYSVASNGHVTFTGAAANILTLTGSAAWYLQVSSTNTTVTVQYVNVTNSDASGYKTILANDGTSSGSNTTNWSFSTGPTKVVLTKSNGNAQTAGSCNNGGDYAYTVQLQDDGNIPTTPTQTTVIRLTTNSGGTFTVYSAAGVSSCSSALSNGDVSFNTSTHTATVYISDTKKSATNWVITGDDVSGDSLTADTENYDVDAGAVTKLVITLPGQSFTDGTGNSGTPTVRTAGSQFNITSISATDDYFNVNPTSTNYDNDTRTLAYSGPATAPDGTTSSFTTAVQFTNGQSTTTLATTLYKAESTTITVTDSGSFGLASDSVTVNPGEISADPADSTVVMSSATGFSETPYTVTITLKDTWRNPKESVASANITIAASASSSVTQPSAPTNASGVTTGSVTWTSIGAKTVDVTISTVSLVQNDGSTADADGKLDDTHSITISVVPSSTGINSGSKIKSGTRIRTN